ncbi:hypothetical protein K466DRAFT_80499 [Polyporus arcularius HHB13444]|uniref:Uncharacterized protein n=1 Tax=Polyporus arcularius HHB13444 TaxID=1314778 RepID=A0A5C3PUY1_9APHY|nr:hypothetical protein K466DRAFT_80499 [Polyporus arcularius HHB13444]
MHQYSDPGIDRSPPPAIRGPATHTPCVPRWTVDRSQQPLRPLFASATTLVHIDMIPRACLGGPCAGCVLLLQIAARRCHARAPRPSCSWSPGPCPDNLSAIALSQWPAAAVMDASHTRAWVLAKFSKSTSWYSDSEGQGLDASRQRIDLAVLRALL